MKWNETKRNEMNEMKWSEMQWNEMKWNDTKANLTSCLLKMQQSDWLYRLYLLLVFAIYKLINIAFPFACATWNSTRFTNRNGDSPSILSSLPTLVHTIRFCILCNWRSSTLSTEYRTSARLFKRCINNNIWHLHLLSIDESQSYVYEIRVSLRDALYYKTQTGTSCEKCNSRAFWLGIEPASSAWITRAVLHHWATEAVADNLGASLVYIYEWDGNAGEV